MNISLLKLKFAISSIYSELDDLEWDYLQRNCELIRLPAKEIIIEEGKIQKNLFFLTSGLVRGFYVDEKGDEITIRFINHTGWITHYSSLVSNTPSKYIFQILEESEMVVLPYHVVQNGYKSFRGLEKFGRLIAENVLITLQSRIEQFQFLNAEERYLSFVEEYPELFGRVSISHLCTYLGMKRQTLTRIRKKIITR